MIWESTILAKLFQEFHPIGAEQKHAVTDAASRNARRTRATYHCCGYIRLPRADSMILQTCAYEPLVLVRPFPAPIPTRTFLRCLGVLGSQKIDQHFSTVAILGASWDTAHRLRPLL